MPTRSVLNVTSTGPVRDLPLSAGTDLATVAAASIFGHINLNGGRITGIFQTTGIRVDPLTGAATAVPNLSQALTNGSGTITA